MTSGVPWKHTLRFSLPVLAGALLQQLYNTVDTIVVGNFSGESSLAAVGTTGNFAFFFLAVALGISAGNGIAVAQNYGAKDEALMRRNASTGILLLLSLGVVLSVVAIAVSRVSFVRLVAVPEEILPETLLYFRIFSAGLVFQFGYNAVASILRAVGDSKATLYFLLVASVLNVALDLLLVAVLQMGVAGAAVATVVSQAASLAAAFAYMQRRYPVFRFGLFGYSWDFALAQRTVALGLPIMLQLVVVSCGLTFIQRAVNGFGASMTAAFAVGQRVEMYMSLPCNAFQTTLATYTGQNVGAQKMFRVRIGAQQTVLMSVLMTLCISVLVFLFSGPIVALFGLSNTAAEYGVSFIRAIAIINIVLSLYIPLFGVFQGTGHGDAAMIVAICALSMRVAATYLFKDGSLFGHTIVWWNGIFGFSAGLVVTWAYYLSGKWKKMKILKRSCYRGDPRQA